jgi:cytochrome c551/c552
MVLSAQAADVAKGQEIAQAQCAACHGKDFASPVDPSYPKLAGQYPDYLEKALRDYQSGTRKNAIMAGWPSLCRGPTSRTSPRIWAACRDRWKTPSADRRTHRDSLIPGCHGEMRTQASRARRAKQSR